MARKHQANPKNMPNGMTPRGFPNNRKTIVLRPHTETDGCSQVLRFASCCSAMFCAARLQDDHILTTVSIVDVRLHSLLTFGLYTSTILDSCSALKC